jgi:hypothetical protein
MTHVLYRQSVFLTAGLVLAILWAFWPTYFSHPLHQPRLHVHAHALPLTLWCVLLFVQAWAIRTRKHEIHQRLGTATYVLVPVILVTTLGLLHNGLQGKTILDQQLKNFAFNLGTLAAFVVLYGLAIHYRRDRATHARYMLSTAFPLFTAFAPRLITASELLTHWSIQAFGTFAALGQAALIPADVMAGALSIWDWRTNRRRGPFPIVLGVLLTIHLSTMTLYRAPLWRSFVEWFVQLPLP